MDDTISRQAAIDVMCELMHHWFGGDTKDEVREIKRELEKLPTVQPQPEEDCDTCKHGFFGDRQCDNCRMRYPSRYEREEHHGSD